MKLLLLGIILTALALSSCSENYSNGERIGFVTRFSNKGIWWKSWDGDLNVTQTGMNTSSLFDFSVDNDNPPKGVVELLDSAANKGWKVKLIYHETFGKNWFSNRGGSDHFITDVQVLDRTPMNLFRPAGDTTRAGRVVDTIYVVIYKPEPKGE